MCALWILFAAGHRSLQIPENPFRVGKITASFQNIDEEDQHGSTSLWRTFTVIWTVNVGAFAVDMDADSLEVSASASLEARNTFFFNLSFDLGRASGEIPHHYLELQHLKCKCG